MCTNQRTIRNCYGKEILVKCGHCPACLQEKAIARTNRIRNQVSDSTVPLFVTLTYENDTVPYIRHDELVDKNNIYNYSCNIYRDTVCSYERCDKDYHTSLVKRYDRQTLQKVILPNGKEPCKEKFVSLHGQSDFNKIGVCYYPDIQNFIKRLKVNLFRKYGLSDTFKFYACSEYGPSSCRPHAHLSIFAEKDSFSFAKYKDAIIKSWTFSDLSALPRSIEVATNVYSYISSYVNCADTVPDLFKDCKAFSQKHSYSKGFGVARPFLALSKIAQMFRKRDLSYTKKIIRNGTLVEDTLLLPKYVISRYFPQHKGFSRLTSFEIQNLCLCPSRIFEYSETLGIDLQDCYKIEVQYTNRLKFALSCGLDRFTFAEIYSQIWSLRACQVLKQMYGDISITKDYFELYDNIGDLYNGSVRNDTLFALIDDTVNTVVNYNDFMCHKIKTSRLSDSYYKYSKDRKIRNYILKHNVYI